MNEHEENGPAGEGSQEQLPPLLSDIILPGLYIMSGALVMLLKGDRKGRREMIADLLSVQGVIASKMGLEPGEQSTPPSIPNVEESE